MTDVTNPDKPGSLTLQVDGNKIEFNISGYEKNKDTFTAKKVVELFQELQTKADNGNEMAKTVIKDLIEEPGLSTTIRISADEKLNKFDPRYGLTFGFKYDGKYMGVDGEKHEFTPERMFVHELAHAIGQRIQPEGNKGINPEARHDYRPVDDSPESIKRFNQKVEIPAVRSENIIMKNVFPESVGVERAAYGNMQLDGKLSSNQQTVEQVLAELPPHQAAIVEKQMQARMEALQSRQQQSTLERA